MVKISTAVVMRMVNILLAVATTMVEIFLWLAVGTMMEGTLLGEVRKSSFTAAIVAGEGEKCSFTAAREWHTFPACMGSFTAALGGKVVSHWIGEGGESGFSAANLDGEGEKCGFTAAGEWQTFPA